MKLHSLLLVLLFGVIVCSSAKADRIGIENGQGGGNFAELSCCSTLTYLDGDTNELGFGVDVSNASGLGFAECGGCSIDLGTGALLSTTSDSWSFAPGGRFAFINASGPGITLKDGNGPSEEVEDLFTNGTFISPVTMTEVSGGEQYFKISGEVEVTINPVMADYYGIAGGEWAGNVSIDISEPFLPTGESLFPDSTSDNFNTGNADTSYTMQLSMTPVPEPSGLVLFSVGMLVLCAAFASPHQPAAHQ